MKWIKRILLGIVVLILLFAGYVQFAWKKNYDVPMPTYAATTDSAMIARGKYLAYGPAHCASCHMPMEKMDAVDAGAEFPLSGGWEFEIPPGIFRAPNLTPDDETGIGKLSDGELARAMRYSVNHRGAIMFPFMPFQELSDEDVVALLSFLRSQPAVSHKVEPTKYKFLGKALIAFGMIKPEGPKATPPTRVNIDSTAAYGAYLAHRVANCMGCHTNRDLATGAFIGEPFAGGLYLEPDPLSKGYAFITPNITPHPGTGRMAGWSEKQFIERFKRGRQQPGSPMPWGTFSRMNDIELKALYAYLQSVPPVENKIDKWVFAPGEKP